MSEIDSEKTPLIGAAGKFSVRERLGGLARRVLGNKSSAPVAEVSGSLEEPEIGEKFPEVQRLLDQQYERLSPQGRFLFGADLNLVNLMNMAAHGSGLEEYEPGIALRVRAEATLFRGNQRPLEVMEICRRGLPTKALLVQGSALRTSGDWLKYNWGVRSTVLAKKDVLREFLESRFSIDETKEGQNDEDRVVGSIIRPALIPHYSSEYQQLMELMGTYPKDREIRSKIKGNGPTGSGS